MVVEYPEGRGYTQHHFNLALTDPSSAMYISANGYAGQSVQLNEPKGTNWPRELTFWVRLPEFRGPVAIPMTHHAVPDAN